MHIIKSELKPSKLNPLILEAVQWFLNLYLPDSKINLVLKTQTKKADKWKFGHCDARTKNDFIIYLASKGSPLEIFKTVFHELIHLEQYALGQLDLEQDIWLGQDYENTKYKNQPWEAEAHGLELFLFDYFLEDF